MTYLERAQEFQRTMDEKGTFEAFEKYYAENCVIEEVPRGITRNGKAEQREAIKGWFSSVEEYHGGGSTAITSNEAEATTMIESWFDLTYKGGGRTMMKEVGIQKWEGEHIVHEKFYYNIPSS